MFSPSSLSCTDEYKHFHRLQYHPKTSMVYSNLTCRGSRYKGIDKTVFFGLQYFLKEFLINQWNHSFFSRPKDVVVNEYKRVIENTCGKNLMDYKHIEDLHNLGYLPLEIRALPEGTLVDLRIPLLTIHNTRPEFFWLTNYIETVLSCTVWQPINCATVAHYFRRILDKYAKETSSIPDFAQWQGHAFFYRGMGSNESAAICGLAHLLSSTGSDNTHSLAFAEQYYGANSDTELVLGSVMANEHSCTSSNILYNYSQLDSNIPHEERMKIAETQYLKWLLTEVHPTGILSYVSDTFSYYRTLSEIVPSLKEIIMKRDGKLVLRPDSSKTTPADVICGEPTSEKDSVEYKGSIEALWDVFGGTINNKGYKELDPHIGLIYGDSINLDSCDEILNRLKQKGFASTNVVFGEGSYLMQLNSRDSLGIAIKTTAVEIDGQPLAVYKSPRTDSGIKKSACGLLSVWQNTDNVKDGFRLVEESTWDMVARSELKTVFKDGILHNEQTLAQIRQRLIECSTN